MSPDSPTCASHRDRLPVAILAGGLGTRLRPFTDNHPKVMARIGGKPFVHYLLEMLCSHGIQRVVMCVGYQGKQIQDYVADGAWLGLRVEYLFDAPSNGRISYGTANAVRNALFRLGRCFWVINGDTYLDIDYSAIEEYYRTNEITNLMVVYKNENRCWPSNVELVDGQILVYSKDHPTSQMQHIDAGAAILQAEVFEADEAVASLPALYSQLVARHQLAVFEVDQEFYEINTSAGLDRSAQHLQSKHDHLGSI